MFLGRLTRLQTFCGCISLRLGCLIIGYIEIVGNSSGIYKSSTSEDEWEDVILYLLGAGFLVLINFMMVLGVHKDKKVFILPWLIFKVIGYLGFTYYYGMRIWDTAYLLPHVEQGSLRIFILSFCGIFALILLLAWYTFFIIYSFYKTEAPQVPEIKKDDVKDQENKEENKEAKKEKKNKQNKEKVKKIQ